MRLFFLFLLAFLFFSEMSSGALAAPEIPCPDFLPGCGEDASADNAIEHSFFETRLPAFLKTLMSLAAAGSVLMGVAAGAMYVVGGGNDDLMMKGKKTLIFSLIGLLVSAFALVIVELINRLPLPT